MKLIISRRGSRRGMALLLTLAFLVLLTALVLAFFSTVQTEVTSAGTYDRSVTAKQIADSATQLVMGQITDGTKSLKPGGTAAADRLNWASQPGLIRSWDVAGNGWKAFKLYSAADMVIDISGGAYKPSAPAILNAEVPPAWPSLTARYTDLNAPVIVPDNAGPITRDGKKYRASYPIVDAGALIGADAVEGFSLTATAPGSSTAPASLTAGTDPSQKSGSLTSNPIPMPVAWVYVLRDGTLTVPNGGAGTTATWGTNAPSSANPIVGRVAFWTDDESSKININTASEPTPWDTPRMVGKEDLKYGINQPAAMEFQRFPGHPFMTALSPVFFPNTPSASLTPAQKEQIYQLIPRIGLGGSLAGTKSVLSNPIPIIATDQERLFANVDEFLFQPNRSLASNVSGAITPAKLKQSRFFLTANSRAPEINLFGQPRVSLWPVWNTVSDRTTYDKLSAFCSTLGTPPLAYYFQRSDDNSTTADWSGIQRNRELYGYLQNLTSETIPGFGAKFSTKWNSDQDQILTEIFDYIRCVNLKDPQSDPGLGSLRQGKYFSENQSVRENRTLHGQVTPITINNTKGFGRFNTISQFAMHFICVQDGTTGLSNPVVTRRQIGDVQGDLPVGQRAIEAAFIFEPFSPSLGWYALKEFYSVDVQFSPMTINGTQPLNMRPGFSYMDNVVGLGVYARQGLERGGSGGIRSAIDGFTFRSGSPVLSKYPWTSQVTTAALSRPVVTGADQLMEFSGGIATVRIYSGLTPSNLVQTFTVEIPGGNIPIPSLVPGDWRSWTFFNRYEYNRMRGRTFTPGIEYPNAARRWVNASGFNEASVFRQEDVVRAVVPNHGDIRLIAAKEIVPIGDFVPVRADVWQDDPNARLLHIFSEISGTQYLFGHSNEPGLSAIGGITPVNADDQLHGTAQVSYHYSRLPEIRPGAGRQFNRWGDFDNGLAQWTDGAYINKPDEGNVRSAVGYPYFTTDEYVENDVQQTSQRNLVITFSPSRIIPSAGMLGSLPTGVMRDQPWQTLLFRPEVTNHPGLGTPQTGPPYTSPPDSLVMDLFWNPAVEPYAISEPFSTAGKVNMNYEIVPFTYIRRATALHGVMKAEEPLLIPNTASKVYKLFRNEAGENKYPDAGNDLSVAADWKKIFDGIAPFDRLRRPINMSQTLGQFDTRFSNGEIFRSATQICDIHLVRDGETLAEYTGNNIWPNNLVTGDNTRERPYTNLYARLTTKSNVFTVHMRAQVLRQPVSSPAGQWDEAKGQVVAEFRGSTILERYIDSTDPNLVDYALPANKDKVTDDSYRFRVVANKKFTP